ncbi:MAG: DUF1080 domain-containing protein [Planctomycetaceae bacterium]
MISRMTLVPALFCSALCALTPAGCRIGDLPEKTLPEDETPSFKRLTLSDFSRFVDPKAKASDGEATWTEKDGVIRCTGRPRGYIYTKKSYSNFELQFEFKYDRPKQPAQWASLNTGCLFYMRGEHRIWPDCLEVQGKYSEMGDIKSNARHIKVVSDNPRTDREDARKEPGNWNHIVLRSRDGQTLVSLNDHIITGSRPTALKEGWIGFQSEGSPVEFRNIRIRDYSRMKRPQPQTRKP